MLIKLLRANIGPFRGLFAAVLVFQTIQTIASLYLPSLNADIIDNGVAKGDTGYIFRTGGLMLGITLVQVVCAISAVYFGAKVGMGIGRELRRKVFHRVQQYSARELGKFGAASLITRNTNDVTQVQTLVVMACTLFVAAPIMCVGGVVMALREDAGLSWLMLVSVPALLIAVGSIIRKMVPGFRAM